jgi:CheY-like chemotaxis protein
MLADQQTTPQEKRVLVVEDEYLVAMDLSAELRSRGYTVVGPAATVDKAQVLAGEGLLYGAVLDMCLAGRPVFEVARELLSHNTPFLFVSGYSAPEIPSWIPPTPRYIKPIDSAEVVDAVDQLTKGSPA